MHQKDLIQKGFKSKGKEINKNKAITKADTLKKQGKIKTYILSKYQNGMWEIYGR